MSKIELKIALSVERGSPHPVGATADHDGVNFSLFSGNATGVELLLFHTHDDVEPFRIVQLDPHVNKTFIFGISTSAGCGRERIMPIAWTDLPTQRLDIASIGPRF